jgi:hypothetical protein
MADNLSALITDAFDIYSEAYVKIAELGSQIVDLDGQPRQPKKINQLIEATMLYSVVADSINLNDAGTAIEGITGDIATMNNLLLKLKRSVGLNSLPQFPTPLTVFSFDGSCECECDGGCPDISQIDTTSVDDQIELDMAEECEVLFLGSSPITEAKTWVISNDSEAKKLKFNFEISGAQAGASHDQTMPSNVKMSDGKIVSSGPNVWRPYEEGEYEAEATTYNNGQSWVMKIFGPVT